MTATQADINKGFSLVDTFDAIYTSMALHHIKDTETTLGKRPASSNFEKSHSP